MKPRYLPAALGLLVVAAVVAWLLLAGRPEDMRAPEASAPSGAPPVDGQGPVALDASRSRAPVPQEGGEGRPLPDGAEPPFGGEPPPEEIARLNEVSESGTLTGLVLRGREPGGPGWAFLRNVGEHGALADDLWEPAEGVLRAPIDAAGRFRFEGYAPGRVEIAVRLDDGTERRTERRLAAGMRTNRVVFVLYTSAVEGRVYDDRGVPRSGRELSLAPIGPSGIGTSFAARARTDLAGAYRFDGLTSGRYRVVLRLAAEDQDETESAEVALAAGEVRRLDFGTPQGLPRITGRLVASDGTPRSGRRLIHARRTGDGFIVRIEVDEEGRFERGLAPGEWRLTVGMFGGWRTLEPFGMPAEDRELEVRMPDVLVTGSVRYAGTYPDARRALRGTSLRLEDATDRYKSSQLILGGDGRFELHGVPPGRYVLKTYPGRLLEGAELELAEGERRCELELVLGDP